MNRITLLAVLMFVLIAGYAVGRSRGFNQGWDKGYIRGVLQYDNEAEIDRVETVEHTLEAN